MLFRRCDRCGAKIEEEKRNMNVFQKLAEALREHKTFYIIKEVNIINGNESSVDICEACQDELREFLNRSPENKTIKRRSKSGQITKID